MGGYWKKCYFFPTAARVDGQLLRAAAGVREGSLGRKKWEKTLLLFLGSESRGPVRACVYVGEYK